MNKIEEEDKGQLVFHKKGIYITPASFDKIWIKFDSYGKRIGLFDIDIQNKVGK